MSKFIGQLFPYRSPGPFTQIRPPETPVLFPKFLRVKPFLFLIHYFFAVMAGASLVTGTGPMRLLNARRAMRVMITVIATVAIRPTT